MLVGKKWKIESDSLNVTLSKRHMSKPKDGKPASEYWTVEGYYGTVNNALKALVDFGVRETALADLKTVGKKLDELYTLIGSIKSKN